VIAADPSTKASNHGKETAAMTPTARIHISCRATLRAAVGLLVVLSVLAVPSLAQAAPASPGWRAIGATGPTNLPPFNSEVQRLLVNAEGGTFALGFEAQETAQIPFNATPAEVRGALEALGAIDSGNVEVSGGPGDASATSPYFIRFVGSLAMTDVGQVSAEPALLTGAGHTAGVSTVTQGGTAGVGTLAIYATNIGGAPTSGPIKVAVGPLPPGITAATAAGDNGTGWSCSPSGAGQASVECETSATVASGHTANPLTLPLSVAADAPATSSLSIAVHGGGATGPGEGLYEYTEPLAVSAAPASSGIQSFWAGAFNADGTPATQAGGHPNLAATGLLVNTKLSPSGVPVVVGDLRTVNVELPPGFIGNPLVTASRCPQSEPIFSRGLLCGEESLVGYAGPVASRFAERTEDSSETLRNGVYNTVPPFGYAAEFPFEVAGAIVGTVASLRSEADYGITISAPEIPQTVSVFGSFLTLYGNPPSTGGRAFLTNPTDCAEEARQAPTTTIANNSWQDQDPFAVDNELTEVLPAVNNCAALAGHFRPSFSFQPQSSQAASPSAFTAKLAIPQEGLTDPAGLVAPELKKAVVTLPTGLDVNPSSANGLAACSESQIGLTTTSGALPNPIRFDKSEPSCPDGSKLGTVEAKSPLLEETLAGTVYLAAQEENPFHSLLALYLVIDSPKNGILVKLPGEVKPDPNTGQLTATFDNNPQLPLEDLTLHFRGGGPRSPLATPAVCSTYTTHGELTPWSAPESGAPAQTEDSFQVSSGPGGGACATSEAALPFSPSFEAGTTSTQAGAYAPLVIKLARKDGEQELTHLDFTLPLGLTGKLAGIPYCPETAIEAAKGKTGKVEQTSASCPAASELGTVDTAAGIGSEPIHVDGHVYLAGPYEGAPLSAVVITPAVAGPFDLGDVVVRAGLYVNPETAQITAKSDEIPHILRGIPLQLRSVEIKVTRDGFTLNPTSCNPMTVGSSMGGLNGGKAAPSSRFQVGGCSSLPFKPQLKLSVLGKTNRNAKPRLKAVLTAKPGEANIARAQVNLPHSEFLEQNHIKTVCTRVQFAEGDGNGSACPKGSVYGKAKAWSPLLEKPLEGNVYLRSNGGERKLPDLVAALDGQIDIALWGKVDSGHNKGIRNTFEVVPDAPVSRFVLEMNGGKKGLLVNSENLCSPEAKRQAIVRLTGQNGKVRAFKPIVANSCKKNAAAKKTPARTRSRTKRSSLTRLLRAW
jgi:hypothetical protein